MRLLQNLRRSMGQKPNSIYICRSGCHEEQRREVQSATQPRRMLADVRFPRSILVLCLLVFESDVRIGKRKCSFWTSFITPTDLTLAAFVVWVALVALLAVNSAAFWCDVSGLTSDISLHGLENGRLNPSRSVPFGLFLAQEVQIIRCLGGQAHCDDGFSISHGVATL